MALQIKQSCIPHSFFNFGFNDYYFVQPLWRYKVFVKQSSQCIPIANVMLVPAGNKLINRERDDLQLGRSGIRTLSLTSKVRHFSHSAIFLAGLN